MEISEEDGYDIQKEDSKVMLILKDVEVEDSGKYTVEIENSSGLLNKTFTLEVEGKSLPFIQ